MLSPSWLSTRANRPVVASLLALPLEVKRGSLAIRGDGESPL